MKTQSHWDHFYMDIVNTVSNLSYATDRKVGCLIVKDDNILSFSYNGTPRGTCNDTECNGKTLETVYHAEEAAIMKMAKQGIRTLGCTLYCNLSPCIYCSKLILQAGICRVVYDYVHKEGDGIKFLKENNVVVHNINDSVYPVPSHCELIPIDQLRHTGLL
jgi:dCMP deaminase